MPGGRRLARVAAVCGAVLAAVTATTAPAWADDGPRLVGTTCGEIVVLDFGRYQYCDTQYDSLNLADYRTHEIRLRAVEQSWAPTVKARASVEQPGGGGEAWTETQTVRNARYPEFHLTLSGSAAATVTVSVTVSPPGVVRSAAVPAL